MTVVLNLIVGSTLSLLFLSHSFTDFSLDEATLELIKVPVTATLDFERLDDHEIVYHKKLYDVVKEYTKDGFQFFYCFNDSKEEKLLQQIRECTTAHLDYFNSGRHSLPVAFKLLEQQNSEAAMLTRDLTSVKFTFSHRREIFNQVLFLRIIYSPPEGSLL